MKPGLSLPIGLLAALLPSVASATDFIRQIQTINGQPVVYDVPITGDQGSILSKPVTADTSIFQLYSQVDVPESGGLGLFVGLTLLDISAQLSLSLFGQDSSTHFVKIDETTVGTYVPDVKVEALSEDPHVPARTRADRPYGMRIVISGMQPASSEAPEYAKKLQVRRSYRTYDPVLHVPTAVSLAGEYSDSFVFRQNGTFTDNAILQRLPADQPTKAVGEETFTAYTHPDAGTIQSQLASATVQVWPVATATVSGIDETRTYLAAPVTGALSLADLYPKSVTYVQVYHGAPELGKTGTVLPSSVLSYDTNESQNAILPLSDLALGVTTDGLYTLEVLTITPFNTGRPERLAYKTFTIDRTIRVNANITTYKD